MMLLDLVIATALLMWGCTELRKRMQSFVQDRRMGLGECGRALFAAGVLLVAFRIVASAAAAGVPGSVGAAIAASLRQDPLLAATVAALAALGLRSGVVAMLLVAATGGLWLHAASAVAVLAGIQVGQAVIHVRREVRASPRGHPLAARLVAAALAAGAFLLWRDAVAAWLAAGTPLAILALHGVMTGFVAALSLALGSPLSDLLDRWWPARADASAIGPTGLRSRDLAVPSRALAASLREAMRMADLVDRMLMLTQDVILRGDVAAVRGIRDAEARINAMYAPLRRYLAQVARQPLAFAERERWEQLMAFIVAAEQVADGLQRMLDDLERKKLARGMAYPAEAEGAVLALLAELARNMRLAAGACLHDRAAASRELAAAKDAFRRLARTFRTAHVAQLVEGDDKAAAISSLHVDLMADLLDLNERICTPAMFGGAQPQGRN